MLHFHTESCNTTARTNQFDPLSIVTCYMDIDDKVETLDVQLHHFVDKKRPIYALKNERLYGNKMILEMSNLFLSNVYDFHIISNLSGC